MTLEQTITLTGTVQAVGMRPAIFNFSQRRGLTGRVVNRADAVEILWQAPEAAALDAALAALRRALPEPARDAQVEVGPRRAAATVFTDFSIGHDRERRGMNTLSLPDRAPCAACRAEIFTPGDRRYHYAFNSCGVCGVRATVIDELPYERAASAWRDFPMCPACQKEYDDPANRRFHIESTGCPDCAPTLEWQDAAGTVSATGDEAITRAARALDAGEVVALKGVGGFQLLADAYNPAALIRLRGLKRRPRQPLALLARDMATVRRLTRADAAEVAALESPEAPIVLLPWQDAATAVNAGWIAPDAPDEAGFMLPSSPLHWLLLARSATALVVATSGNAPGAPPALDAETMRSYKLADHILTHNRTIEWRHDDSLVARSGGVVRHWRRARGCPWRLEGFPEVKRPVLALGGMEKNSFAVADKGAAMLSTYCGGLGGALNARAWRAVLERTLALLPTAVAAVAVDGHPDYYSTVYGEKLAARLGVPLVRVQHHYAHALAALGEAGLTEALALVFDGTGLGTDGTLWGSELLYVSLNRGGRRLGHFRAAPLPGGEAAILAPERQYQARRHDAGLAAETYPEFNAPESTAAGRLFDAFAARLGVAPERVGYEGEAAIRLEYAARRELAAGGRATLLPFAVAGGVVDWRALWREALPEFPALSFHATVAAAAVKQAEFALEQYPGRTVLLTGGVFQNRLLVALLTEALEKQEIQYFIPAALPVNDGALAAGQIIYGGLNFVQNGVDYKLD